MHTKLSVLSYFFEVLFIVVGCGNSCAHSSSSSILVLATLMLVINIIVIVITNVVVVVSIDGAFTKLIRF